MRKYLLLVLLFLLLSTQLLGEDKTFGVGFGGNANTKDLMLQVDFAYTLAKSMDLYLLPFFAVRPCELTVFEQEGETSYYQYKERRFNFGIALSKHQYLFQNYGLFAELGGGVTIGDYSGISKYGPGGFIPVARAGFVYNLKNSPNVSVKVGYEYLPMEFVPDNRGFGSVIVRFF